VIIHHRRTDDGAVETRFMTGGALHLDPPGLPLDVDRTYHDAAFAKPPA
jgi:hypothetical protein